MPEPKQNNPILNLFIDIKKIIDFIEIKDINEAMLYETPEIAEASELWMAAKLGNDTYLTYRYLWTYAMFQEIIPNVKLKYVNQWIEKPHNVPLQYRDNLLLRSREAFLNQYVESNQYYRMLSGLPPSGTKEIDFVYLSDTLKEQYNLKKDIPIHELTSLLQNRYINTKEYQKVLQENPDKRYLQYLGIYKVDLFIARKARDLDLIRYTPINRSDINPNLLKEFGSLYNEYREYVMRVLYNDNLEEVFVNYRPFMKVLILSFVIFQICNKSVESVSSRRFLDDSILHIILSMHGIPDNLLMSNEIRRKLVVNLLKLTREKGTNDIYKSLIDVLGYQDITIKKLMLVKNQIFSGDQESATLIDGTPLDNIRDIDDITFLDEKTNRPFKGIKSDPYFVPVNIDEDDIYSAVTESPIRYSFNEITESDPTWWNLSDTTNILQDKLYNISDTKYIMIEAVIQQVPYLFESIYFPRMILDNREATDSFTINIPEIFGTANISLYDVVLFLISATCMITGSKGTIPSRDDDLLAIAGFNFDLDLDILDTYVSKSRFIDRDRLDIFLENLSMKTSADINRIFNEVLIPMRDWIENKLSNTAEKDEFVEYESLYKALFTYDIANHHLVDDFRSPMDTITERYNLSEMEIMAYKLYYPHRFTGETITVDDISQTNYNPFVDSVGRNIAWFIVHPFKGRLYLYDILNSPDIRYIKAEDNSYFFMNEADDGNGNITLEIDYDTVRDVINIIDTTLERDTYLKNAVFRVSTPIIGSNSSFSAGERLPYSIRSGIFKDILLDKITLDIDGLADLPLTYMEYLRRKNKLLYDVLYSNDRFNYDHQAWINDITNIILAVESELNVHVKYFEQSIIGSDLFFKPLLTIINHFKSTYIACIKTAFHYIFGDKIDAGGNCNMIHLFDAIKVIIHFVILKQKGMSAELGLYDTEKLMKYNIIIKDRPSMIKLDKDEHGNEIFIVDKRVAGTGSLRMVDEMKFFKNGNEIDSDKISSSWYVGESETGRWSDEDDHLSRTYKSTQRIQNKIVDYNGWKEFVEK
jgi:hypothetical protein